MTFKKKRSAQDLVAEAEAEITTLSVADVAHRFASDEAVIIDLRDVRELWKDGKIPGAVHVPRGLLEFWVDPENEYHNPIFAEDKDFIFYCAMGWRSALATKAVQDMGLERVSHIDGGFKAWREAGHGVEPVEPKKKT